MFDFTVLLDILLKDVNCLGINVVIASYNSQIDRNKLWIFFLLNDAFHILKLI